MVSRAIIIGIAGIAAASAMIAAPQGSSSVVGVISSTQPITINGSEMSPSVAPSWPLAPQDEIATSAPAMLQTSDRNVLTFDALSKARISAAGNGLAYIYIRQGGVRFNAATGPVYVCIGDHLFAPAKSAQGLLRIDQSGKVVSHLDRGVYIEQGVRACAQDVAPDFLSGLPQAAGGSIGPPAGGGLTTSSKIATGVAVASAVAAGMASLFASSPCASPNGCNFNPASLSPSQP
jgi:hypothetical protein